MKLNGKKIIGLVIITIVLAFSLIAVIDRVIEYHKNSSPADSAVTVSTEETISLTTESKETDIGSNEDTTEGDTENSIESDDERIAKALEEKGISQEDWDAYIYAKSFSYSDEDVTVQANTKKGTQTLKFGLYDVTFDDSFAKNISFIVDRTTIEAIVYNDGNDDDVKGYFIGYPIMDLDNGRPETIDDAKRAVGELIAAGSGIKAEWEETDGYFVRKCTGYSSNDKAGVIYYTIIPKRVDDNYLYQIILTASKSGDKITFISEKSFDSAMKSIAEGLSDSELFETDYDKTVEELDEVTYYETATFEGTSSLTDLMKAHRQYLLDVYGTTDVDSLTEEEQAELFWKYMDEEGYEEEQEHQKEVKAAEEKAKKIEEEMAQGIYYGDKIDSKSSTDTENTEE